MMALGIRISIETDTLVAEQFIQRLATEYGEHPVSMLMVAVLGNRKHVNSKSEHHLHSSFGKSVIERTVQYVKDTTECFDDYFSCRKNKCILEHVRHRLNLFVDMRNEMTLQRAVK
jgi:transposase-like protein